MIWYDKFQKFMVGRNNDVVPIRISLYNLAVWKDKNSPLAGKSNIKTLHDKHWYSTEDDLRCHLCTLTQMIGSVACRIMKGISVEKKTQKISKI